MTLNAKLDTKRNEYQSTLFQIGQKNIKSGTSSSGKLESKTENYTEFVTEMRAVQNKKDDGSIETVYVPYERAVVKERQIYEFKQKVVKEGEEYAEVQRLENKAFNLFSQMMQIESNATASKPSLDLAA